MSNYVLGFDFGMKYIGIAIGQFVTNTASPLKTIKAKDGIPNWDDITEIINKWSPKAIIVGMPYNMDGSHQQITFCAQKFANRLKHRYRLEIHTTPEQLSSWEAKNNIATSDKNYLNRVNCESAAIILQQWMNQNHDGA